MHLTILILLLFNHQIFKNYIALMLLMCSLEVLLLSAVCAFLLSTLELFTLYVNKRECYYYYYNNYYYYY